MRKATHTPEDPARSHKKKRKTLKQMVISANFLNCLNFGNFSKPALRAGITTKLKRHQGRGKRGIKREGEPKRTRSAKSIILVSVISQGLYDWKYTHTQWMDLYCRSRSSAVHVYKTSKRTKYLFMRLLREVANFSVRICGVSVE